jgi:hypothetical protein
MELLARLMPTARTMSWPALTGGSAACLALTWIARGADGSPLGRWPGVGALALCTGAAFLFDDAAQATTGATPTSLARRRALRVALALPLVGGVWSAALWYATAAGNPSDAYGPSDRGALTVQFVALLAVTLAVAAVALRAMPDQPGGWTGVVAPCALLAAAYMLPHRWALLAAPGEEAWPAAQQRWAALLALALLTLAWASRDPARRSGVRDRR